MVIDWNKYKGKDLKRSKDAYVELCELLHKNGHTLESEYVNNSTKVIINFNCEHEPHLIVPYAYKKGQGCPKCAKNCPTQSKEEFLELLHKNGHTLEGDYINNRTKVMINFNCGHEPHLIAPCNYKKGHGCPMCPREYSKRVKEEFLELLDKNGHTLESEYVNNKTKVLINYNCGHKPHLITPNDYKSGKGCPKCAGLCPEQAKEEFLELLHKNGHELLSDYINNSTKVLINYNCGHEPHLITPCNYKKGHGCPMCAGLCPEQAKKEFLELLDKNGHTLLDNYINSKTKVMINFNCGHEPHLIQPNTYKKGNGCPKCAGVCSEQAKEEFLELLDKNGHTLLDNYINSKTKVMINFNCGHEPHLITPNSYKRGIGCPMCINKGEGALGDLLATMFKKVEHQKTYNDLKHERKLHYDFYIPKHNLLIELDGEHHRLPVVYGGDVEGAMLRLQERKYKDKLKNDYAKSNGIHLLRIEYNRSKIELDKWKQLILNKIKEIEEDAA